MGKKIFTILRGTFLFILTFLCICKLVPYAGYGLILQPSWKLMACNVYISEKLNE